MWFLAWAPRPAEQELQLFRQCNAARRGANPCGRKLTKRAQYSVFQKMAPSGEHGMCSRAMPYAVSFQSPREKPPALQQLECAYKFSYALQFANSSSWPWVAIAGARKVTYQRRYTREIVATKLPAKSQRVRRIPSAPLGVCGSSR